MKLLLLTFVAVVGTGYCQSVGTLRETGFASPSVVEMDQETLRGSLDLSTWSCNTICKDQFAHAICLLYRNQGLCNSIRRIREICLKTCDACGNSCDISGSCTNDPPLMVALKVTVSGPYTGCQVVTYTCNGVFEGPTENICLGNNMWELPSPLSV